MTDTFDGYMSFAEGRPLALYETLDQAKCALSSLFGSGRNLCIECQGGESHGRQWRYDEALQQWVERLN